MQCRAGCGACCIAPSISSPIPAMPLGKPAGQRCVQLDADNRCLLFGQPERPNVCLAFSADFELCGDSNQHALQQITMLELSTADSGVN
ncbi:MAG: YkgJ family cysteine cluster protein [Halopseudomonas sp.]